VWWSASRSTHSAAVANWTRCPAWQVRIAMPVAKWVLPVDVWGLLYPPPPPSGSGPSGGLGYTTDNDHGYTGPRCYEPDGYHFNPC